MHKVFLFTEWLQRQEKFTTVTEFERIWAILKITIPRGLVTVNYLLNILEGTLIRSIITFISLKVF